MFDTISTFIDSINIITDTTINIIKTVGDTIDVDLVKKIQPSDPINSTIGANLSNKVSIGWKILPPSVLLTIALWFFNGRPKIFIQGVGRIEQVEDTFGNTTNDYSLKFSLINSGKRAAKIKYIRVAGYNDPGPPVSLSMEEGQDTIQGGICLINEISNVQNPLAPNDTLEISIPLTFFEASASYIVIKIKYKDDELKIYRKKKSFYYIQRNSVLEDLTHSEKSRLDQLIHRELQLSQN